MRHVVALSGGKDSVAMALALREYEPLMPAGWREAHPHLSCHPSVPDYEYVYTPTGWELPEMDEHMRNLELLLGRPIVSLPTHSMDDLIQIQKALPNWRMRWCTRKIKIEPFERFIRSIGECVVYVGIRADETGDREGVDYDRLPGVTRRFPMDEWGWDIQAVLRYLDVHGIVIPERTDCDVCFFQTLYEWWLFWKRHPVRWMARERLEEMTGHTFRSEGRDTWPAAMKGLRLRFEAGDVPKDRRTKRATMCSVCAR